MVPRLAQIFADGFHDLPILLALRAKDKRGAWKAGRIGARHALPSSTSQKYWTAALACSSIEFLRNSSIGIGIGQPHDSYFGSTTFRSWKSFRRAQNLGNI